MSYHFLFTEWFDRNLKFLRKHNPTLSADFETFLRDFEAETPPIIPRTGGARKARKENLSAADTARVLKIIGTIQAAT